MLDFLIDKIEKVGQRIAKNIEKKGRAIEHKGDALFGAGPYDGAPVAERIRGVLEPYDDNEKKIKAKKTVGLKKGDVVAVARTGYKHYGVYVGRNRIIHYTSDKSDIMAMSDASIRRTSFSRFLRDAEYYFVIVFPDEHNDELGWVRFSSTSTNTSTSTRASTGASSVSSVFNAVPLKTALAAPPLTRHLLLIHSLTGSLLKTLKGMRYKLYSPEETVQRACSRLGEKKYRLPTNNCEHFAIWCKTGIRESHQVNRLLKLLGVSTRLLLP